MRTRPPLPSNKPDFEQPIAVGPEGIHIASLYFDWGQPTIGFGQCSIILNKDGTVVADTEGMGREWLRRALYAAVDALVDRAEIV